MPSAPLLLPVKNVCVFLCACVQVYIGDLFCLFLCSLALIKQSWKEALQLAAIVAAVVTL